MNEIRVDARPTKAFFIENLIRDLTLEDALLDLVDNSIDSAIHTSKLDVSADLLRRAPDLSQPKTQINIDIAANRFVINDFAGGIDPDRAVTDVFRLGRPPSTGDSTLGVYGIGLKRAIFKMGRHITVRSWHEKGAFEVEFTPEWLADESNWMLPYKKLPMDRDCGTEIAINDLREEIRLRVSDPALLRRLRESIARTYSLFLQHLVSVQLNGSSVDGLPIPLGDSGEVRSAKRVIQLDEVTVELMAGLQPRVDSRWEMDSAGWYVLCNGRVVVSADKTDLTGWGTVGPQFNPKHRGFVGVAFFFSENPSLLPWTTTKRGLNREAKVYQLARREMVAQARPVLSFLNGMYPSETPEEQIEERLLADTVRRTPLHEIASRADAPFTPVRAVSTAAPAMTSVQFKVRKTDVDRVRKCLGKLRWSNGQVGAYTFEYFLKQECPEP